jgi:hypothetical protein
MIGPLLKGPKYPKASTTRLMVAPWLLKTSTLPVPSVFAIVKFGTPVAEAGGKVVATQFTSEATGAVVSEDG